MTAEHPKDTEAAETIPTSNRVVGGCMVAFGSTVVPITYLIIGRWDRDVVVIFGVFALILLSAGGVIGFRDYLSKTVVAGITIAMGVAAMLVGAAILAWVAYNLFVERQKGFRFGNVGFPVVLLVVGFAFVKKGLSGLKQRSNA
jgi:di/tricarboxylate transporter